MARKPEERSVTRGARVVSAQEPDSLVEDNPSFPSPAYASKPRRAGEIVADVIEELVDKLVASGMLSDDDASVFDEDIRALRRGRPQ